MIILDNSALSAFTNLHLLDKLENLFDKIVISSSVLEEYSKLWKQSLPRWINIVQIGENELENKRGSLSSTDADIISYAIVQKAVVASDDLELRKFALKNGVRVIGSLGILKQMYKNKLIKTDEEYIKLVFQLSEDVYLDEDLIKWALDVFEE